MLLLLLRLLRDWLCQDVRIQCCCGWDMTTANKSVAADAMDTG
jgi:hypothetical protein